MTSDHLILSAVGMLCVTALEIVNMTIGPGFDGLALSGAVGIIAGLAGFRVGVKRKGKAPGT